MRMKQLLLASAALATCTTAAQADGMYVSVFGGANFFQDTSQHLSFPTVPRISFETDRDTGFVLGGAIGAGLDNWARGLRVEVEASYRRQDIGGDMFSEVTLFHTHTGTIDANQSTFAIMANAWYDIDLGWKIVPYVGGGAGWARSSLDLVVTSGSGPDSSQDENSGFAWQLGLGFNYEVQPGVDLGLGYRYFEGPDNDTSIAGNHGGYGTSINNENHSVLVNLTIDTN